MSEKVALFDENPYFFHFMGIARKPREELRSDLSAAVERSAAAAAAHSASLFENSQSCRVPMPWKPIREVYGCNAATIKATKDAEMSLDGLVALVIVLVKVIVPVV